MPRAFLLEAGLDWETLAGSLWSWLEEAMQVLEGRPADDRVTRLLAGEETRMREFLEKHGREYQDRFVLAVALAVLGTSYAALEKLAFELQERGFLEKPAPPAFDTYR
jgi:transposase